MIRSSEVFTPNGVAYTTRDGDAPSAAGHCFIVDYPLDGESPATLTNSTEHEVYVNDKCVVWSCGGKIRKSFTLQTTVKQALWCRFDKEKYFLVVLHQEGVNVYHVDGSQYSVVLPCKISKIWATSLGLLLEREIGSKEEEEAGVSEAPVLFSLSHPLEELKPVSVSEVNNEDFLRDPNLEIVFASNNSSIVVTYHTKTRVHSLWCAHKFSHPPVKSFRVLSERQREQRLANRTVMADSQVKDELIMADEEDIFFRNVPHTSSNLSASAVQGLNASALLNASAMGLNSSMGMNASMMGMINSSVLGMCSTTLLNVSALNANTTLNTSGHFNYMNRSTTQLSFSFMDDEGEGITSDVFFRCAIEDSQSPSLPSTSVFFAADETNQKLICLHVVSATNPKQSDLRCYKIGSRTGPIRNSQDLETLTLQHSFTIASVRFAAPIRATNRKSGCDILVVGPDGSISVHIGNHKVYSCAFPFRDLALQPSVQIVNLSNSVFDRVNFEFANDSVYRISFKLSPESPLVDACLRSLYCALAPELYVALYGNFVDRLQNATSTQKLALDEAEWQSFIGTINSLLGELRTSDCDMSTVNSNSDDEMEMSQDMETDDQPAAPVARDDEDEAWNKLLASNYHQSQRNQQFLANLTLTPQPPKFPTIPSLTLTPLPSLSKDELGKILIALHLVYEDCKLDVLRSSYLFNLATLLTKLASHTGKYLFIDHYLRDFGELQEVATSTTQDDEPIKFGEFDIVSPPSIYGWIMVKLRGAGTQFPCITNKESPVETTRKITKFFTILASSSGSLQKEAAEKVVLAMASEKMSLQDLETVPFGIALPFREALRACRNEPPDNWPVEAYILVGREDLAHQATIRQKDPSNALTTEAPPRPSDTSNPENDDLDGCDMLENDETTRLRFGRDRRVREASRLLRSSKRLSIRIVQQNGVSDHDFVLEQQARLLLLAQRVMALSVGRGMFTLSTMRPMPTDAISIPPLEIGGKVPSTRASVSLDLAALPADFTHWPEFHNGVAAGMRMAPAPGKITSTWIVYNRPKELSPTHAGLLMALGLQGHLSSLAMPKVFEYLTGSHPITSTGLILGLGCAKRGTMDASIVKVLSIHITSLHPPASTDLEVPPIVQTAAIVSLGLLYLNTAHRRTTEVLLTEIGRKPNDDRQFDREGYSLAAGLALGLVTLGRGDTAVGLSDLKIEARLTAYMIGTEHESPQGGHAAATNAASLKSSLVLGVLGGRPNVEITSAGAQVALGLMYLKTNNQSIAARLDIPSTMFLLERVRPDLLLMRVVCKSLVLWDSVAATEEWIQSHVPAFMLKHLSATTRSNLDDAPVDMESVKLAHLNIIAGACLALGIRYAGSRHQPTYDILMKHIDKFQNIIAGFKKVTAKSTEVSKAHKVAAERGLNAAALALAVVMAGSGNLNTLRVLRTLRLRLGQDITYGNHMAIGMAIGMLFMGGGVYTLSTSNVGIAGLVAAFYPIFPVHSGDNRYHLQALRHLYVLAAEPRCLIARDVDTHAACYVPIEMTLSQDASASVSQNIAPCLLPSLELIREFRVCSPRYWPVTIKLPQPSKSTTLIQPPVIYVKRKTGFLPYSEDPVGFRSILSRSFPKPKHFANTEDENSTEKAKREVSTRNWEEFLGAFSSDPSILAFVRLFCNEDTPSSSFFTSCLYECLTHEKPEMLQTYIYFRNGAKKLQTHMSTSFVMNVRVVITYYEEMANTKSPAVTDPKRIDITANEPLLQSFFVGSLKTTLDSFFDQLKLEGDNSPLANYLAKGDLQSVTARHQSLAQTRMQALFGAYLAFYEIPPPADIRTIHARLRNLPDKVARSLFVPMLKTLFGNKHSLPVLLKMAPCWPATSVQSTQ